MIPYSHQFVDKDDTDSVKEAMLSDWLTQGPKIKEFEKSLADYCGTKYAVAVSNGTAALHASYFVAGIQEGDEVIMPPLTFAATANAAIWQRAKPVFVDVDETGNIKTDLIENKITQKTKGIVIVDYAGLPCDFVNIKKIAKKYKLVLIEDAAHSLGAEYKGVKIGDIADLTTLSFHPVKSITTGEGGAILTNNKNYYEKLLLFRSHGITRNQNKFLNKNNEPWHQEMQELGLNYRLTDIQAALGVSQLKKLDNFISKREKIAAKYDKDLKGIDGLILPKLLFKERKSSWHLYPIRVKKEKRRFIFEELQKSGIGVQVHYIPVYWHPYYQKLGYKKGLCPNAEKWYESEISIPIYPSLTKEKQEKVIKNLKEILKTNGADN